MRLIAVTGWGQHEDKQRARAAGFDAHLTKPVEAAAISALPADDAKTAAEVSMQYADAPPRIEYRQSN